MHRLVPALPDQLRPRARAVVAAQRPIEEDCPEEDGPGAHSSQIVMEHELRSVQTNLQGDACGLLEAVLRVLEPIAWHAYVTSAECHPSGPKIECIVSARTQSAARQAMAAANTPDGSAWVRTRKEIIWLLKRGAFARAHMQSSVFICACNARADHERIQHRDHRERTRRHFDGSGGERGGNHCRGRGNVRCAFCGRFNASRVLHAQRSVATKAPVVSILLSAFSCMDSPRAGRRLLCWWSHAAQVLLAAQTGAQRTEPVETPSTQHLADGACLHEPESGGEPARSVLTHGHFCKDFVPPDCAIRMWVSSPCHLRIVARRRRGRRGAGPALVPATLRRGSLLGGSLRSVP